MKSVLLFFALFPLSSSSKELIDSTYISRTEAIEIAKENHSHPKGRKWEIEIVFLEEENQWRIISTDTKFKTYGDKIEVRAIWIDARTGDVVKKSVDHHTWPPPKF